MEGSDEQLIFIAAASGDTKAFEELVRRHQTRIRSWLLHLTNNSAQADDLAQDTFLRAWNRLGSFQGRGKFSSWLMKIAYNNFLQSKRQQARDLRLTMNKLWMATLALVIASNVAAQTIDETRNAHSATSLYVDNMAGSVEISGWDRDEVRISGTTGDAERIDIEQRGDRVVVEVVYPRGGRNLTGAKLAISAPREYAVTVDIVSAALELRGIEGAQNLSSVSGKITTEQFSAAVTIRSVSGDTRVDGRNEGSSMRAVAVSGDIELNGVRGEVSARSVSGDVQVEGELLSRGEFETTSGDLSIEAEIRSDSGRLDAMSVSGDVEVVFDGDLSASYRLNTLSGSIENCFGPSSERVSRYGPGSRLSFAEGDASAQVVISTTSGDIELCRS
jgi:RNA polymerase sigma factor (sigma-70 family)